MPESIAAPSAAPGTVAPASPATPTPPAPSAAPSNPPPLTLADYDRIAAESIRKNAVAVEPTPAPAAPSPTGQESPPAEATTTEAQPPASTEPAPSADSPEAAEGEEAEPSPEEQAGWTEGERRLHGALVKERQARKDAKSELKELRAQVEALQAKLQPNPNQPPTAEPPATPAPAAAPSVAAPVLAECETFEAVDARVMAAAASEADAMRLQMVWLENGFDAVLQELPKHGIAVVDGVLVDANTNRKIGDATSQQVGALIANAFAGAKAIQAEAPSRKAYLVKQVQAYQEAAKFLPDLADPKSEAYQRIGDLVRANPIIRQKPDWPVVAAKLYLGEQAWNSKRKPAAATPPPTPKPVTPPSAPGAPRTSVSSLPKRSEVDELAAKLKNGTATNADVDRLASLRLQANAAIR